MPKRRRWRWKGNIQTFILFVRHQIQIGEKSQSVYFQSNENDVCPDNSQISVTDFTQYEEVLLDPDSTQNINPNWVIRNKVAIITS